MEKENNMKKCLLIFFVLLLSLTASTFSASVEEQTAAEKKAKQEDIKKLLELTGAAKLGIQVIEQMIPSFKKSLPEVPVKFWEEFLAEANADDMVNLIIPIYDEHISHADIKVLIKFYETPAGKRFVKIQPELVRESMATGQKWGRQLALKIMEKLKKKDYR
jgi:hypothetical protein